MDNTAFAALASSSASSSSPLPSCLSATATPALVPTQQHEDDTSQDELLARALQDMENNGLGDIGKDDTTDKMLKLRLKSSTNHTSSNSATQGSNSTSTKVVAVLPEQPIDVDYIYLQELQRQEDELAANMLQDRGSYYGPSTKKLIKSKKELTAAELYRVQRYKDEKKEKMQWMKFGNGSGSGSGSSHNNHPPMAAATVVATTTAIPPPTAVNISGSSPSTTASPPRTQATPNAGSSPTSKGSALQKKLSKLIPHKKPQESPEEVYARARLLYEVEQVEELKRLQEEQRIREMEQADPELADLYRNKDAIEAYQRNARLRTEHGRNISEGSSVSPFQHDVYAVDHDEYMLQRRRLVLQAHIDPRSVVCIDEDGELRMAEYEPEDLFEAYEQIGADGHDSRGYTAYDHFYRQVGGAQKEEIQQLPTMVIASPPKSSNPASAAAASSSASSPSSTNPAAPETSASDACTICLGPYEPGDTVRTLKCLHMFHAECVDEWLVRKRVCPNCKDVM